MPSFYLNDAPIEELGLVAEEGQPHMPRIAAQRDRQPWPNRVAPLLSASSTHDGGVRRFTWGTNVDSVATRNSIMEWLYDVLVGTPEVRDRDTPTRVTRGPVRVFEPRIASPSLVNLDPSIVVEIETPGASWDVTSQSRVLSTTPVQIPCGTLAHGGRIYFSGASAGAISTEMRIRYRGITGTLLGEMVLLPSLASGEYGIIDLDSQEIVKVSTSNVMTSVDSWLTGGNFFVVSPRDGYRRSNAFGTMEITAGAALYTFRRLWKD